MLVYYCNPAMRHGAGSSSIHPFRSEQRNQPAPILSIVKMIGEAEIIVQRDPSFYGENSPIKVGYGL